MSGAEFPLSAPGASGDAHPASATLFSSSAAGDGGLGGGDRAHRGEGEESLSSLEREVLEEYARLVGNLDDLSTVLASLASKPSAEILDALRGLERKTTTVFTLLKASVYSIVLQQEIAEGP